MRQAHSSKTSKPWRPVGSLALGLSLLMTLTTVAAAAFRSTTTTTASWAANDYFTCRNAITPTTPYLWYRMDETSNTTTSATDSSGNNRTGTYLSGNKTASQLRSCTGDTGTAMLFNGAGYLASPVVAGAAPNVFTIGIWFKTTSQTGGKLIGYGNARTTASTSYDRHLYLTNNGRVTFGVYPNAVRTIQTTDTYRDGQWHHAVGTLSSAGMSLYVDGEPIGTDTNTTSGQALSLGYWRVAYDNLDSWTDTPSSRFFTGTLDDAVVETSALSAAQVKAWYLAGAANVPVTTTSAPTGGPAAGRYQVMNYWNLVLDPLNGAAPAGTALTSAAVTSSSSQTWQLQPMSDGNYKIISAATGRIVGIEGASTASGARAVTSDDHTSDEVLWKIAARGAGYTLINVNSGLPLVVLTDTGAPNAELGQATESGQKTLIWRFNAR